ncbi:hypothetical protein SUGI_0660380 [Cryptomeria japonica]|uniref:protein EMBRYO SAC DEVELOPMENT ARREST 30 n=1 Tax=Cryptomeria japonica TaxID=3369 RepID=UPI00241479E8|nr:protein EMBRYO SAC DEVELOPMENT ARREST 30 [Cryptomeria japonica]GLJ32796.1 hypothetical protein SUGI_0660380 [Cryptomeria japonica]
MIFKSKIKWAALVGLLLSLASLVTHLLLARSSTTDLVQYKTGILTIFNWRPVVENEEFVPRAKNQTSHYRKLWGPVKSLQSLQPFANPRSNNYPAASWHNNGFIFVKLQGGFQEIRTSICDVVAVARLLNATLVIPELQETTSTKRISLKFKSFGYLYNEEQFIAALINDVLIVKSLPKRFKTARKNNELPVFSPAYSASTDFYLREVLPSLKKTKAVGLLISGGGCLQPILPPKLAEYQRLRCRVAFHALRFRQEIWELGTRIVKRLQASGRPYLIFHPGLVKDALAYHGCAELFQDVHTEMIQHRRLWMIKHGIIQGDLSVDSEVQRHNGSCPLMPEEVGILLRALGYPPDTIIYVSGGEVFGGQRVLIPLRAMFNNLVDRTSLCTDKELSVMYGPEEPLILPSPPPPHSDNEKLRLATWQNAGPRPRPLAPPAARPKYPHEIEGWWGWVAEADKEPEPTPLDFRMRAHKLLWEALDYIVSVEADAFFPGFNRDGNGRPDFASLVMGHRIYESASLKTYRPDRKVIVKLFDDIRDHLYKPNHTWLVSVREHLNNSTHESGLIQMSLNAKPLSFLSHPLPECACRTSKIDEISAFNLSYIKDSLGRLLYGGEDLCPEWMNRGIMSSGEKEKDEDDDSEDTEVNSGQVKDNINGNSSEETGGKSEDNQPMVQDEEMDVDD